MIEYLLIWGVNMFKNLKILDEKDKRLRLISKEVTFPLSKEEKETIELPLMGEIFVSNALLAIAVGSLLEIPLNKIDNRP